MGKRTKKRPTAKSVIRTAILIVIVLAVAAGLITRQVRRSVRNVSGIYSGSQLAASEIPQITALAEYVFGKTGKEKIIANLQKNAWNYKRDDCIVFLSLSPKTDRADVVNGKGRTLEEAWQNAEKKAVRIVSEKNYEVVWAKADIVNTAKEISLNGFYNRVSITRFEYFYRKGIALDKNFNIAFLEAELNGNKLVSYKTSSGAASLQLNNINNYLNGHYGYNELASLPEKVTTFTTIGFFCDEENNIYDLYTKKPDYGRRVIDIADDKYIEPIILNAANYLYNQLLPNGRFIYGNNPIFDDRISGYNILRHTGSTWSLINLYRMTGDEGLVPKIDSAINFLLKNNLGYKDADTAYSIERTANEVRLGANGLAIVMLTEYMDVFKTDKYTDMVRLLANGILELQDGRGRYYHVLNYPDWSRKEEYRTVYYDGEATFGLARAYTYTRDQRYLDAAARAVENFITGNYQKYADHWISYSLNEVTKYIQDPRYFKFAMLNVQSNLGNIGRRATSSHIDMELLLAGWQTYERMLENGITIRYPVGFKAERLAETIYKRAFHMLNDYFYPEYAMYMHSPYKIVGTFFVRHQSYRVRIDDVQHFIGGYYYYTVYFEKIRPHLSDKFLSGIHKRGI